VREQLLARLRQVGVDPEDLATARRTPWEVWLLLHDRWGHLITLVDLYELEAAGRAVPVEALPAADRQALAKRALVVQYPGWQEVAGGFRGEPVEIQPYDESWPDRFQDWRRRLAAALGGVASRIAHVGSTAVPGLAAKPVVDIQVSVADLGNEPHYVPAIEAVGVLLRSREHARRYFRPPPPRPRAVQLHVCAAGSDWEREHLLFRDYLRADHDARVAYADLKRELAVRWRDDRLAYTGEKTAFILDALGAAEVWVGGTGWTVDAASDA